MSRRERFEALFAAYSSDVVAYCGWRAGSASDAQDAVADVFLTAWRRLDELPEGDAARVWLYATARRVLANQRRSLRRRLALQERLAGATGPQSEAREPRDELVHEALRRLTPAQIGTVVGCRAVTARGRLHRARRRFRTAYEALLAPGAEHDHPAFLKEDLRNV